MKELIEKLITNPKVVGKIVPAHALSTIGSSIVKILFK
jgi:hypothetical protein